jgi:biofilm PGA synthesis N-glycosyltransferase PgaC
MTEALAVLAPEGRDAPMIAPQGPVLQCSVGIMAYNEEANIAHTISSIVGHRRRLEAIGELIVVASGCTDRTAEVVAGMAHHDSRIRLILQERREGKASAINTFIGAARSSILVMVGADVLVEDGTIEALLRHFQDPDVGMVGGRPIPVNDEVTFMGHAVHLQWRLHDRLARKAPKLGEIVAFRNVVPAIPLDTAVDEISIQALVSQLGYRLVYEPQAIVYNRGPSTIGDFLRQRRRIHAGHLRVRMQQGYEASTMSAWKIFRALLGSGSFATPRVAWWTLCTIGLEATARALGRYDRIRRRSHHIWEAVATTKQELEGAASPRLRPNVLVFHITNFRRHQLELGSRASRRVTEAVVELIHEALGPASIVSTQQGDLIVALLPGNRDDAEHAIGRLLRDDLRIFVNGQPEAVPIALTSGIISFSHTEQPFADLVPIPINEPAKSPTRS